MAKHHEPSSFSSSTTTKNPLVLHLHEKLSSCSTLIESGDEKSIAELVDFIDSVSDSAVSNHEDSDEQGNAVEVLSETHKFLLSPSLDQAVIDALSFELPKAVSKFAGLSNECLRIADSIIDFFIENCSPRDMLPILCEALDSWNGMVHAYDYVAPLLSGISKVLLAIQRRHFEQVKVAVPVILNVLKAVCSELSARDTECMNLFIRALGIADSIRAICAKLEGRVLEKLRDVLSSYILQIMALLSLVLGCEIPRCLPLVSRLSEFFPFCGLSYLGLITGSDVDEMTRTFVAEEEDDYMRCLSYIKHGAAISVIWGHISVNVARAAGGDVSTVKDEILSNQTERWQAVGMLKHIFSFVDFPWELKKHAIDFLLCITDGNIARNCNDEDTDCSIYMPNLYAALQAITMVIMYTPDTVIRKNAFEALKRVLADIPTSQRFEIFQALITNSMSSPMTALLLDLVRSDLYKEGFQRTATGKDEEKQANKAAPLWVTRALELVELIFRPPKGGPPSFPEHGDAVLAALNLYRFILMTESAGKTNYTGVLSKKNLEKAFNEWLLPLRALVAGIMAENKDDHDPLVMDTY
ncbi:aberrant root formation protein 4 isoform X2 [Populus nigra]|uniref:aberrant root formation protein 4 isoform X2 n=1 Tax=Populus nigra TaxID=3691 RepID=UPI002B26E741|nr:aberrant root formation protein 4 isoform X2 [Populus nigra]